MIAKQHWIKSKQCDAQPKFKRLLISLSKKAKEKDVEAFEEKASLAIRFAETEGSPLMMSMVYLQLANAYLVVAKVESALNYFRRATVEARKSREIIDEMVAIEIEIQSLYGEGSVFFATKNYGVAGRVYKESAEIAESTGQYLLAMDGWLMASFCYELQEQFIDAYRCSEYALLAGEKLPENNRPKESFAQLGDTLLRIVNLLKINQFVGVSTKAFIREREIDFRMQTLIGRNWRKHLPKKK